MVIDGNPLVGGDGKVLDKNTSLLVATQWHLKEVTFFLKGKAKTTSLIIYEDVQPLQFMCNDCQVSFHYATRMISV